MFIAASPTAAPVSPNPAHLAHDALAASASGGTWRKTIRAPTMKPPTAVITVSANTAGDRSRRPGQPMVANASTAWMVTVFAWRATVSATDTSSAR